MFVILFMFPTSLVERVLGIDSEIGEACIPKKAEEPIIQTAKKTRHGSCWYERLPVAADKENKVADDAQRMGAVR